MPFRMSITAIAAKRRLVIFERAFVPASPRTSIKKSEDLKTAPASRILTISEMIVADMPYSETMSMEVVRTAGPAMSGVPIGTAPSSEVGLRLVLP